MSKTKLSMKEIVKYLRDFSIVVAGIAVTLYVNDRITTRSEKNDLKLYFNAIKLELEENRNDLDKSVKDMQISVEYADYLRSHDKKSINKDTLDVFSYPGGFNTITSFVFKTNAFEMFKTSGSMRLVKDKELMLLIWNTYAEMSNTKTMFDLIMEVKLEDIKKELKWSEEDKQNNIPMRTFYLDSDMAYESSRLCQETSVKLKETIEKLKKML